MMKVLNFRVRDESLWDRLGMGLSLLCALHCLLTPVVILSLPFLARYYLMHPVVHLILAMAVVPVGIWAFISGFRRHHNYWIFVWGLPGLFLIAGIPYLVHSLQWNLNEPMLMVFGSGLLLYSHWLNRRACRSCQKTK